MWLYPKCTECDSINVYPNVSGGVICSHCDHHFDGTLSESSACCFCSDTGQIAFFQDKSVEECPHCARRTFETNAVCSQCGSVEATEIRNACDDGAFIICLDCGLQESRRSNIDYLYSFCGWTHELRFGAGSLMFRRTGEATVFWQLMHGGSELDMIEGIAREKLQMGEYVKEETRLSRWNSKTKQLEIVLGDCRTKPRRELTIM
jgi:hypothetical protein